MSGTFFVYTLGCKVNQYESESIIQAWERAGLQQVAVPNGVHYVLINSCAVTEASLKDVRSFVAHNVGVCPNAQWIVTGCAASLLEQELRALLPQIQCIEQKAKQSLLGYHGGEQYPYFSLKNSNKSRPTVVIQDGCSHVCTYCIIPYTRGVSQSRPLQHILQDIDTLVEGGYKEICLSAVNMRQYGQDYTFPMDVWDLVQRIEKRFSPMQHNVRFRLSSLEPCQLNEKALMVLSQSKLLCHHLHISLQSASQTVLERMGRGHYTPEMILLALQQLQKYWDVFALGLDIITGFPGETEEEFLETEQFLSTLPLSYAHIFPFSERPFTKARVMEKQIPVATRRHRAKILRGIATRKRTEFIARLQKEEIPQTVVAEKNKSTIGVSQYYIRTLCEGIPAGIKQYTALPMKENYTNKYLCLEPSSVCGME